MHITHICSEFGVWCSLSSLALFHHPPSYRLLGGPQGTSAASAAAVGPRSSIILTIPKPSKSPYAVHVVAPNLGPGTYLVLWGDRARRPPQRVARRWAPQHQKSKSLANGSAIYSSTASVGVQQQPGPGQAS